MNISPGENRDFFADIVVLWPYTTNCKKFVAVTSIKKPHISVRLVGVRGLEPRTLCL